MPLRRHDHPLPAVGRQRDADGRRRTGAADHRQVDAASLQLRQHFAVAARLQVHADLRVALAQRADRGGQGEARLGVGGGDAQLAARLVAQVGGDRADVGRLGDDRAGAFQHVAAGVGHRVEALALAHEQLEAQLVLKLAQLLAQAGLGGVDALGGQRDVEAGVGDGNQVAQLGQGHGGGLVDSRDRGIGARTEHGYIAWNEPASCMAHGRRWPVGRCGRIPCGLGMHA